MLNHPTIDRLRDLGLVGMIHALEEQKRHQPTGPYVPQPKRPRVPGGLPRTPLTS